MKLGTAVNIAAKLHENQLDKGGSPYIFHPIRVCTNPILETEEERVVGILHDTVEDYGEGVFKILFDAGLTEGQAEALLCVTRAKGESWTEYVERIITNITATKVKIADLEDSMDVRRLIDHNLFNGRQLNRYHSLWVYLRSLL